MSSMLLERLARVAYEAMVKDTKRWYGIFPMVLQDDHSWDAQPQSNKHAWMNVAQAIQQELKTPEWPAVGEEYVLSMRNPKSSFGCTVTKIDKNSQGVWCVYYDIHRAGLIDIAGVSVLWQFQEDAKDYREWNSLGGDKS